MKQHIKNNEKKIQPAIENKKTDENASNDSANERVQDDDCAWKKPAMFWLYQNAGSLMLPHSAGIFSANAFKK